ncbi:MAG: phosphate acetyltransferase [Sulfurovum sp.]
MDHKSIYISALEPHSGSLNMAIGFMEMLKGTYAKVAFFRPIISSQKERDNDVDFMLTHFELNMSYDQCCGFAVSDYIEAYGTDQESKLYEALIHKVNQLKQAYDFILIEGYPRTVFGSVFDFDINLEIAKNLDTAFIPILNARDKPAQNIMDELQIVSEAVSAEGCILLATIVNRCSPNVREAINASFASNLTEEQIYVFPEVKELDTPTLAQVIKTLNAQMLLGDASQLQHLVHGKKIAAMGVENYLSHIENGDIVIVSGDRVDIILASILSFYAKNHSNIVALILSGGIRLSQPTIALLQDFSTPVIPIFSVQSDSYQTAIAIEKISTKITPQNKRKITLSKGLFDKNIDKAKLLEHFINTSNDTLTPMMFQYRLFEQAKSDRQKIILPESNDERILQATEILIHRDIVDVILLGNPKKIHQQALKMDIDISKAEIINPEDESLQEKFAQLFYEMRKDKGLTLPAAKDMMTNINYFATMMIHQNMADGMVSGATHTTADTLRPALQIIKTKKDISIVSSIFFMCLDTKVLVYGDCAVNLDPTAEELAQIAISSADTAKAFGIEPKVALLSYSTGSSGSGPEVEKVKEATRLAQMLRPEYQIEGPIQYDAAIDAKVAKSKLPNCKLVGNATVFIFPDLNTGNNTYKAVQRSTNALAIGPILQGLRLPINDLSRGCLVDDIVNTVVITAIQAQKRDAK